MRMRKIISAILAGTMLIGSMVFTTVAQDAQILPEYDFELLAKEDLLIKADSMTSGVEKNYKLDYGVTFTAKEDVEAAANSPYAKWKVDAELIFSGDATAVLAGQYDGGNNGKWLAWDELKFEANTPVPVLERTGLNQYVSTYDEMVATVGKFNCGIKFDNATPEGTTVTVMLTMTDPATGTKYVIGEGHSFTYTPVSVPLPDFNVELIPEDQLTIEADGMTSPDMNTYELDFGMIFEAVEDVETAAAQPYAKWKADFYIEFSKETPATLLGYYDGANNDKWLSLGEYTFPANTSLGIMEESTLDRFVSTYEEVVTSVKKFYCGLAISDAAEFGTDITLKLCLTNPETSDKYTLGEYTYTYDLHETTDTNEEIVEKVNSTTAEEVKANAEKVKETVANLDQKNKDDVSAEVIKALVETETTIDTEATEPKAYTADTSIDVSVEETAPGEELHEALDGSETFDITVTKNGVETYSVDVPVLIAIPIDPSAVIEKVVHIHNGAVKEITNFYIEGSMLYIQMSEFSYIGVFYSQSIPTGEAVLKLAEIDETDARYEEGKAKFDIILEGDTVDIIKNFVAGEFTVAINGTSASFDYDIAVNNPDETTLGYSIVDSSTRNYRVYLSGSAINSGVVTGFKVGESWTSLIQDAEIVLGTLTINTYGTGSVQISDVLMMKHDGTDENLAVEIPTTPAAATSFEVAVPQRELTINVVFNNKIENVDPLYNDMTITISGGELTNEIVYNLGKDVQGVVFDEATCTYTVKTNLTKDRTYTVVVEGKGYRTARYPDLNMRDKNRTLTFWNNAKNDAIAQYMEVDEDNTPFGTPVTTNFLAGDVIKDNIINIYDLSAVVSYFGEEDLTATNKGEYVMYDLNRDGKIDSKDVAYVLVSWER